MKKKGRGDRISGKSFQLKSEFNNELISHVSCPPKQNEIK